ncbi:MAG: rod shape-determining protein MreD [Brevinema sp.]
MKDNKALSILLYVLTIFFLLAMQSIQLFSIAGIHPDLLLIVTIIVALSRGSFLGEIFGFFVGFSLDLMSGSLFGLNAFVFTFIGVLATPFQKAVKVASIIVYIFYIIFGTILKYMLFTLFYALYEGTQLFDLYFLLKIPGEIVANIVLGIIFYIFAARIYSRDSYDWF